MKNIPSFIRLMEEIQSLKMEMSELKTISTKQTELLEKMGGTAEEPEQILTPKTTSKPVESIDYKISMLLHELGIPTHIKGYSFIREAVKMTYLDDNVWLVGITKYIYPEIATKFHSTPSRVERAIRHAIEMSWHKNKQCSFYSQYTDVKPTNSQLIADIVDYFKLEEMDRLVPVGQM